MIVEIDRDDLKTGILGLVIALVEIIRDALRLQALKRMDGGSLTGEEIERLGRALMDLDAVIDEIKDDHELGDSVRSVRDGLDDVARQVIDGIVNPERWQDASAGA